MHLALNDKTYIMGILNVTPDSFSDGGKFLDKEDAVRRAIKMTGEGADIIDVGGESTRPGAGDISPEEELNRVIPVIEMLFKRTDIPISIDTRRSKVAQRALNAGASIVNDVSGLRYDPMMAHVVADLEASLIVMHMKGSPKDMQRSPRYKDLIGEIRKSLKESLKIAGKAGVRKEKIIVDPGIGFGKTVEHNLAILKNLAEFKSLGQAICIGTSRKSFIAKTLGLSQNDSRLYGTLATCVVAIMNGANILRVHDVKEAVDVARMTDKILCQN